MENEHVRRNAEEEVEEEVEERRKYPDYCRTLTFRDASGHVKELVLPKALDLDRPKRARTTFSPDQLYQLESEFCRNQYLVGRERSQLAVKLGLSETQVKVWFQNRRTKYKRDKGRDDEVKSMPANSSDPFVNSNIFRLPSLSPSMKPTSSAPSTTSLPAALSLPPSMNFGSVGNRFGSFSTASLPPSVPPGFPVLPMMSPMYPLGGHPVRPVPLSSGMPNSETGLYGHATYSV